MVFLYSRLNRMQKTLNIPADTISFDEYKQLTRDIVSEQIPRAGIYENDSTFRYTRSNMERMEKVLQNIQVSQKLYNALSELQEEWVWLVLSEPWCGDASWGTPALHVIATCSDKIEFEILLRDKHPEIMKDYQTEGTDSIPKLICVRKKDGKVLGTWGPRPLILQSMINEFKNSGSFDYRESVRKLHAWYEQDMTISIQDELLDEVKKWKANN